MVSVPLLKSEWSNLDVNVENLFCNMIPKTDKVTPSTRRTAGMEKRNH